MTTKLNLLLIDDDEIDRMAFRRYAEQNHLPYQITEASTVQEGLKHIQQGDFDVIVTDYRIEDGTAEDILEVATIPVIVITGMGNESIAVQVMKTGAADYIAKDMNREYLAVLPVLIENALRHYEAALLAERQANILAATEERQRLARELHDSVSQTLFSINSIAVTLPQLSPDAAPELKQIYDQLQMLSQSALAEMRALLSELRSGTLENTDLSDLLRTLVESRQAHTSSHILLQADTIGILDVEAQIALYRITQEAINNAIKHAEASTIQVQLTRRGTTVQLTVEDDGLGFVQVETRPNHHGLRIMSERATEIGARLSLRSIPRKGTYIHVEYQVP